MAPRKQINYKALNDRLCKTGKEFEQALNALIDIAKMDVDQACRAAMSDLYGELTDKAPKDTGRVTIGFNINEGPSEWAPPPGEYKDKLAQAAIENKQRLDAIPPGRPVTISNNIEYLPPLEDGHSRQAPSGFLASSVRWAARRLEAEAAEFSKKKP